MTSQKEKNFARRLEPLKPADLELLRQWIRESSQPEQYEAITSEKPLTVISAGAGTGKTWTLARRFVWTVLTRTDVRSMLTLTFSVEAAAEMKSRIADVLRNRRAGSDGAIVPADEKLEEVFRRSPELELRRRNALECLDQAYISTIHGFCSRVIGEAGLGLDVEPGVRVVSEPEAAEFWGEATGALDRLDASWFAASPGQLRTEEEQRRHARYAARAEEILHSDSAISVINQWGPQKVADFAEKLESLMADEGESPDTVLARIDEGGAKALALLSENLQAEFQKLIRNWDEVLDLDLEEDSLKKSLKTSKKLAPAFLRLREEWRLKGVGPAMPPEERARFLFDAATMLKGARGNLADAMAERLDREVKEWRKDVEDLRPLWNLCADGWPEKEKELRDTLISLAWLCWCKWENFKKQRGLISFSDMLALSVRILEQDRAYASRFADVLVDEFQDTNGLQDRLLQAVRKDGASRLFIVGDLKQSIYRFRHAEPLLFQKYIEEARGAGSYIALQTSFRSADGVLDAVNGRFALHWRDRLGEGLNLPYEALKKPGELPDVSEKNRLRNAERQKTGLPFCERMIEGWQEKDAGGTEKKESAAEVRERLAFRLALRLREFHDSAAPVWDKESNSLRPFCWGDAAVLVRSRSMYPVLQHAFQIASIPATFAGSEEFYAKPEVRDACALIGFLANPTDRTSLAGYLCSPFSGLSAEEAQQIIPRLEGIDPLSVIEADYPKTAARLRSMSRLASVKGPAAALAELLLDGRILAGFHPRKRAAALANLRRALSILEQYEAGVSSSVVGAAGYLQKALSRKAKAPEASCEDESATLKVMTIHASKGLEFPLVVIFGISGDKNASGREKGLFASSCLAAAASKLPDDWVPDGEKNENCLLGAVHNRLDEQAQYEEDQRLYYVAMTRARDGLILCGVMPKSEKAPDILKESRTFLGIESVVSEGRVTPLPPESTSELRRRVAATAQGDEPGRRAPEKGADVLLLSRRQRSLQSISASSHALWQMCPAAWRTSFRQNIDLSWNASAPDAERESLHESAGGADLGNVAHWMLSKWDFEADDYLRMLELPDGSMKPEFRRVWRDPSAKETLKSFFESFGNAAGAVLLARLREAHRSGSLRREYPFSVMLGSVELKGAADVVWPEFDEAGNAVRLCLRDYKTTRTARQRSRQNWMKDFYACQLKFYAFALKRAIAAGRTEFPKEYADLPFDLALWNLRTGEEQAVSDVTPDEQSAMEQALRDQASKAAGSGDGDQDDTACWAPRLDRCVGCAYRQGCVFADKKKRSSGKIVR